MSEFLNKITFYNPEMFYLFILVFLHILWYLLKNKNSISSISFSNTKLFSEKESIKNKLIHLPYILNVICLVFLIIAIARPQSSNNWEESKTEGIDIIIAMDISGSMLAQDLKPDRLRASKQIAIDFIKSRENDRIGLVIFSGESFTQCPLTTDKNSLINLFNDVKQGMIADGTAIGEGLGTAINRLKDSKSKSKIIILLTDGENNSGYISPTTAANIAANDSVNIKVYTIGVGTKGMAKSPVRRDFRGKLIYDYVEVKIDEKTLKEIANKTGGEYFRATNNKSLEEIYKKIDLLEKTEIETKKFNTKNEEFYPYTFAALFSFLLSFLLQITYFRQIT
ncbi:MAG: vWA domain-containing protein [Flavobacteriales bacterium]